MKYRIKHIIFFSFLLIGVLGNVFAVDLVHDTSKISIEKSAIGDESIKALEILINGTKRNIYKKPFSNKQITTL